MKKLFSLLTAVLLCTGMVVQATSYSYNFKWETDYISNNCQAASTGTYALGQWQFSVNYQNTKSLGFPALSLWVCFPDGNYDTYPKTITVNGVTEGVKSPVRGTYNMGTTNPSYWSQLSNKVINYSSWNSKWNVSSSNTKNFTSNGSMTVAYGRHGYPYFYTTKAFKDASNNTFSFTVGDSRDLTTTYTSVIVAQATDYNKVVLYANDGNGNNLNLVFNTASIDANIGVPASTYTIGTNVWGSVYDDDGYTDWKLTSGTITISKNGNAISMTTSSLKGQVSDENNSYNMSLTISNRTPTKKTITNIPVASASVNKYSGYFNVIGSKDNYSVRLESADTDYRTGYFAFYELERTSSYTYLQQNGSNIALDYNKQQALITAVNSNIFTEAFVCSTSGSVYRIAAFNGAAYSITYKDGGNTAFTGSHESGYPTTHLYGTNTTLGTATKANSTFEGWFTNSACTGSPVTSLGATAYTSNITLYAKWKTTYTLTLNVTGNGTVTVYNDTKGGEEVTFTNNEAQIEDEDNIRITYLPAAGFHVGTHTYSGEGNFNSGDDYFMDGDHTITVTFEPDVNTTTYTLTLNAGAHGTVTVYNNTKNYNVTFTNNEAQIAEDDEIVITYSPAAGYHVGTHTDSEQGPFSSGDGIFMDGDHTITVTFEPDVYNITYKDKGNVAFTGTHGSGYPTTHTYGTATALVNPTKANATFGGWYENSSCTGSAVTSIAATAKTADFTLYAKWGGTITATASGSGSVSGAGTYDVGANVSLTATPSNSNYYLYDWEKDGVSLGVRNNPLVQSVTANAAYTAIFREKEWTLTVNSDNPSLGTASGSGKYFNGENTTLVATPANSFTSFVKWQKNGVDIAGGASLNVTVNANDTYTAFFSGRNIIEVDIDASYTDRMAIYSLRGYSADNKYYVDAAFNTSNNALSSVDGITYNGSNMSFTNKVVEGIDQPCGNRRITHLLCYNATGDVYRFNIYWHLPWSSVDNNSAFPNDRTINRNQQAGYDSDMGAIYVYGYTKDEEWNGQYTLRALGMYFITGQRCSDAIKLPEGVYPIDCSWEPGTVLSYQSGMDKDLSGGWAQTQGVEFGYYLLDKGTVTVTKSGSTYTITVNAKNSYGQNLNGTLTMDESVITGTIPSYTLNVTTDGHGTASVKRYDCNDNLNPVGNSGSYKQGSYFQLEATPSSGYVFDYWTLTGTSEHFDENPIELEGLYDNATVTAHFKTAVMYNVTINTPDNGTLSVMKGGDAIANGASVEEGSVLTVTATPAADYHFGAWTNDGAASVTVNSNVTIGATFAQNDYFLNATYGAGGASVTRDDSGDSETVKRAGNTVTLTPNAAAGYEFVEWAGTDAAKMSGNVFTFPTNGTHNTTYNVQATFQASSYSIIYLDKGGVAFSGAHESGYPTTHTYNAATALKSASKTGYDFGGWFTDENCTGSAITEIGGTAYTSNITLYAKWTEQTYTISLDKNTGATDGAATATYNSNTLTDLSHATKAGNWTLNGYFTLADGGDMVITAGGALVTGVDGYTDAEGRWTRTDGSMTLYAHWTEDITYYTVTFGVKEVNEKANYGCRSVSATAGGADISSGADVAEGTSVTLTAEPRYFYHFVAWMDGETTKSTEEEYTFTLSDNVNLTAVFARDETITLEDNHKTKAVDPAEEWYADYDYLLEDLDGAKVNVLYKRTMNPNTWCVFALPFDYSLRSSSSVLKGKVYELGEFIYTTTGMTLNFPPVGQRIEANKPYLFYSSGNDQTTELVFNNVQLKPIANNSYSIDNSGEGNVGGRIIFNATTSYVRLDEGKTNDEKKKTIYLSGNRLYYLNLDNASWMRAFRGYFTLDAGLQYMPPRVRIVLEGQTATEVEVVTDTRDNSGNVRKYIENGVLVIEREGVRYDATGARRN